MPISDFFAIFVIAIGAILTLAVVYLALRIKPPQTFKNTEKNMVCEAAGCETEIKIGEMMVKKYYLFKEPSYYHQECFKNGR